SGAGAPAGAARNPPIPSGACAGRVGAPMTRSVAPNGRERGECRHAEAGTGGRGRVTRASTLAPIMTDSLHLRRTRRCRPLFATQMLGAFNDNLFKNAMVLFVVYQVYNDERSETWFSAAATAIFILPFFLPSALSGQLADARDKAWLIRIIK